MKMTARIRLVADRDLAGLSNGWFTQPVASIEIDPGTVPSDAEFLGFAFTQFALPVIAGPALDFDFNPAPNLHSPPAMIPLLVRSADGCTLFAPTVSPHEQIITIVDGVLRWGWHGDLDEVPAGFTAELAVYRGAKSSVEVRQTKGDKYQTEVYVIPNAGEDAAAIAGAIEARVAALQTDYPGVKTEKNDTGIHIAIPDRFRDGHEAHFARVTRNFLNYLKDRAALPAWEGPNMLAKYFVTTTGTELSHQSPPRAAPRIAPE